MGVHPAVEKADLSNMMVEKDFKRRISMNNISLLYAPTHE
jgi:hypothetical protein